MRSYCQCQVEHVKFNRLEKAGNVVFCMGEVSTQYLPHPDLYLCNTFREKALSSILVLILTKSDNFLWLLRFHILPDHLQERGSITCCRTTKTARNTVQDTAYGIFHTLCYCQTSFSLARGYFYWLLQSHSFVRLSSVA